MTELRNLNPLADARSEAYEMVMAAMGEAVAAGELAAVPTPGFYVEIPGDTQNGDLACNAALAGARAFHLAPRRIAELLQQHIRCAGTSFDRVECAGPGFLNFYLAPQYFSAVIRDAILEGADWGRTAAGSGKKINVEFVSANPTGPMHLGNARGGALGDCLASVLEWSGYQVTREFYVNDAGNQIEKFGESLDARYRQIYLGEDAVPFPENGYHGDDIRVRAQEFADLHGRDYLDRPAEERREALIGYALPLNIQAMKDALEKYRIHYDVWFLESTLHESGAVKAALDRLSELGATYEKDGALWYRAGEYSARWGANRQPRAARNGSETDSGPKDEVLVRSNGFPTYFASDVAYHYNKLVTRGFDKAIDVWGADHAGHVARMKGAMDAVGLSGSRLDVVLMQLVKLIRDGKPVTMSKRTGKAIALTDLLDEIPVDSARFFFNQREPGSAVLLDLDLALRQDSDNPVYYVQYAHARICSILRALRGDGAEERPVGKVDLSLLREPAEIDLARKIGSFPEEIIQAAKNYDPARITKFVTELSTLFHRFYTECRVRGEETELLQARLALCTAARITIENSLAILKITAPDKM